MPAPRDWYVVMYDVREDKRLRRTHKVLRAWGVPLQYSIFRVRGTAREIERLRFELAQILAPEDSLMLTRLCPTCASRFHSSETTTSPLEPFPPPCHIM